MTHDFNLQMDDGTDLPWATSKVVCVGQNYADHIKEMGSKPVTDPVIFMKPSTALRPLSAPIKLPIFSSNVHHEIELAVIIGSVCSRINEAAVAAAIHAYAVAIDLTARDLQAGFKERGHPWELSKSFDDSCPISACIPASSLADPQNVDLNLVVNGETRQSGNTGQMIHPIYKLISFMSLYITLLPGDVVLSGTPAGVSQIHAGDQIECRLGDFIQASAVVV